MIDFNLAKEAFFLGAQIALILYGIKLIVTWIAGKVEKAGEKTRKIVKWIIQGILGGIVILVIIFLLGYFGIAIRESIKTIYG